MLLYRKQSLHHLNIFTQNPFSTSIIIIIWLFSFYMILNYKSRSTLCLPLISPSLLQLITRPYYKILYFLIFILRFDLRWDKCKNIFKNYPSRFSNSMYYPKISFCIKLEGVLKMQSGTNVATPSHLCI